MSFTWVKSQPSCICLQRDLSHSPIKLKTFFFLACDKSRRLAVLHTTTLLPFRLNCKMSPQLRRCWRRGAGRAAGPSPAEPGRLSRAWGAEHQSCSHVGGFCQAHSGGVKSLMQLRACQSWHYKALIFRMMDYYTHYWILNQGVKPQRRQAMCSCWRATAPPPADNPWLMERGDGFRTGLRV